MHRKTCPMMIPLLCGEIHGIISMFSIEVPANIIFFKDSNALLTYQTNHLWADVRDEIFWRPFFIECSTFRVNFSLFYCTHFDIFLCRRPFRICYFEEWRREVKAQIVISHSDICWIVFNPFHVKEHRLLLFKIHYSSKYHTITSGQSEHHFRNFRKV